MKNAILNFLTGAPVRESMTEREAQISAILAAILAAAAACVFPYVICRVIRWIALGY